MREERPEGTDAVDAFYRRQRAEILRRLPAGEMVPFPRGRAPGPLAWMTGLAAAALVVLSVVAVLRLPPPQRPAAWPSAVLEGVPESDVATLPLPAYGEWAESTGATEGAGTTGLDEEWEAGPASLTWLLAEEPLADGTIPGFLEAYGAWGDPVSEGPGDAEEMTETEA